MCLSSMCYTWNRPNKSDFREWPQALKYPQEQETTGISMAFPSGPQEAKPSGDCLRGVAKWGNRMLWYWVNCPTKKCSLLRLDLGWWTHNTIYRWCVIELYPSNLYNFMNQCHPDKLNFKNIEKKVLPSITFSICLQILLPRHFCCLYHINTLPLKCY